MRTLYYLLVWKNPKTKRKTTSIETFFSNKPVSRYENETTKLKLTQNERRFVVW